MIEKNDFILDEIKDKVTEENKVDIRDLIIINERVKESLNKSKVIIRNMIKKGLAEEFIAEVLEVEIDLINEVLKEIILKSIIEYKKVLGIFPTNYQLADLINIKSIEKINEILNKLKDEREIEVDKNSGEISIIDDVIRKIFMEYLDLYDYENHRLYIIATFENVQIYRIGIFLCEYFEAIVREIKKIISENNDYNLKKLASKTYLNEDELNIVLKKILNKELK